jgi:cell division septation protein DedD
LYAHISRETEYGYKEVQAMAEVYFKTIRYEVGKGLKFTIDDLGYFFFNKARKIEFAQETTDNLLLASYGLSYLNYKEFDRVPRRADQIYQAVDDTNPLIRQRRIRRWIYTGAAACLLASMILVPVKMGYLNLSRFDLSPVDSFRKEQSVQEPVASHPDRGSQMTDNQAISTEPDAIETASGESVADIPAKTYFTPKTSYHIIIGSFKDFENAQQLKQKMVDEGNQAEILSGENSFFRVSANQYQRKEDAITALSAVRDQSAYKSAWILALQESL